MKNSKNKQQKQDALSRREAAEEKLKYGEKDDNYPSSLSLPNSVTSRPKSEPHHYLGAWAGWTHYDPVLKTDIINGAKDAPDPNNVIQGNS